MKENPHRSSAFFERAWRVVILVLLGPSVSFGAAIVASSTPPADPLAASTALTPADDALLNDLESASFRFFVEQSDPVTGLIRDRARADGAASDGKASIAACGFALSAYVIGTERHWIDRADAVALCRRQLRFLATQAPRVHGFFYHFMEMHSGARAWKCEVSTIDTGLFLAGAITAREYFRDPEITRLVDQIYRDVDWQWFLDGGKTFVMSWSDEDGFSHYRWNKYSELMTLMLLGIGAPQNPIPAEAWGAWQRGPIGNYAGFHYIQFPSLFVHQFTHAYIDFRGLRDAYADYYRNSVLATLAQRQFCFDLTNEFPTWRGQLWGLTASDSASGYKGGWGGPPRTVGDTALDGTIVPCASAGSVPFTPRESLTVLHTMRERYGNRIWKRYGFVDAFNPQTGWVSHDVIGIDVGIQLTQAENARTGLITSTFTHAPEVQQALTRAGFLRSDRAISPVDADVVRTTAASIWRTLETAAIRPETAGRQLSAIVAAHALGFIATNEAADLAAKALEELDAPPTNAAELGEYAAGLVTVRQAFPNLAALANRRLAEIPWSALPPTSNQLASRDRLTVFFQISLGARPAIDWSHLSRAVQRVNSVYVLASGSLADQLIPGLWLDEHAIITGASTAQLAYARALNAGAPVAPRATDALATALFLEYFPGTAADALRHYPNAYTIEWSPLAAKAALLIAAANALAPDSIRCAFQRDPLIRRGRTLIAEFQNSDFGPSNSTYWRHELAGPDAAPQVRPEFTSFVESTAGKSADAEVASTELKPSGESSASEVHRGHTDPRTPPPKTYIIAAEPATAVRKPWRDRRVSPERRA